MLVGPGIEVKAIEGHALDSDRDDGHTGANLAVEAVLVHAEIPRRIPESYESGRNSRTWLGRPLPDWGPNPERRGRAVIHARSLDPFRGLRGRVLTHARNDWPGSPEKSSEVFG